MHNAAIVDLDTSTNGSEYALDFVENSPPVYPFVYGQMSVVYDHLFAIVRATVTFRNHFDGVAEVLAWNDTAVLAGTYDNTTSTLTFVGEGSPDDYLRVLATVTYENTQENPTGSNRRSGVEVPGDTRRELEVTLTDETQRTSLPVRSYITVVPVNDAPRVYHSGITFAMNYSTTFTENARPTLLVDTRVVDLIDVDNVYLTAVTVTIAAGEVRDGIMEGINVTNASIATMFDFNETTADGYVDTPVCYREHPGSSSAFG